MNDMSITARGYENAGDNLLVDRETGELVEGMTLNVPVGTTYYTPKMKEASQERRLKKEEAEVKARKKRSDMPYVWIRSDTRYESLSDATLARMIYLSMYCNYNKELKRTEREPITKDQLCGILGLSKTATSSFWKETKGKYLDEAENGSLVLLSDSFFRGQLRRKTYIPYQRFYIKGVKKLYESVSSRKHKQLGYVFSMLPYVNTEYNVICWNPDETDFNKIAPMTVTEFCESIEYSRDHASELRRIYGKISFDVDGHKEPFCSFVFDGTDANNARIFVNPRVFYAGSDMDKVAVLGLFCKPKET